MTVNKHPMLGDLTINGHSLARAGFLPPVMGPSGIELGPSTPIITRGLSAMEPSPEFLQQMNQIQRGEFTGDVNQVLLQIGQSFQQFQRAITASLMPNGLPVRENLESESRVLIPLDTPVRNKLPRHRGAGRASEWYQTVSLGGGYAPATTIKTEYDPTGANKDIVVANARGFIVGEVIVIDNGTNYETATIDAVDVDTNTITVHAALSRVYAVDTKVLPLSRQPGSEQGYIGGFFKEDGPVTAHQTVYARKSAGYKLLGTYGAVSGLAAAAGANFQNQLATEKTNAIRNLMLNEENALINGDSTSTAAPWGDGSVPLAFDGLVNLISVANGTPADQVQTNVGALTTAHIDNQLRRLYNWGAQGEYIIMNPQEILSLVKLAESSGSIIRVRASSADGKTVLGVKVTGYVNPITGNIVDILASRFLEPGTILFCSERLPDGTPSADVDVLPQVQLPELAPNEQVQGYVAQELAPSLSAPQVYPFIVSVYEVLRMFSAKHFAKSVGVTAA